MKTARYAMLLMMALAAVFSLTTLTAAAAGTQNASPDTAAYIDNQSHSIAADGSLWYRFDYAGDRSPITVTLVNGNNSGLAFNVLTPDQAKDWWEATPIGRGTPQQLNCNTLQPAPNGQCQGDDLMWMGDFNAGGPYYVQVLNHNPNNAGFDLMIEGTGVSLGKQMQSAAASAAAMTNTTPSTTTSGQPFAAVSNPSNYDPAHALAISSTPQTIPATTSRWYMFNYAGDKSAATVRLLNGNRNGLQFNVFTPEQIADWWEATPIGKGTPQGVNCNTGEPSVGVQCSSDDLLWVGQFNSGGPIYVQVYNPTSSPVDAPLMVEGSGVMQ